MEPVFAHRWDVTPREALALQRELAALVRASGDAPRGPFLVAGCDAAGSGRWARRDERITACVIVFRFPGGEVVERAWARGPAPFPYVPGLLSFREIPLYLEAFAKLTVRPDLLVCDGQGIAHPRRFGLASHLGVLFDLPAIGAAKSRLIGTHGEPGRARGRSVRLMHEGRIVGRVVRTQEGVKPLFVSPGHRIGIAPATALVLRLAPRYRLPEPTRQADRWVRELRRSAAYPFPAPVESSSR
jgi:deoxyribonuclease V